MVKCARASGRSVREVVLVGGQVERDAWLLGGGRSWKDDTSDGERSLRRLTG